MKITGHNSIPFPVETVWDALLDPAVLVRTIPGCERLETTGEHTYDMTVTAGVASIKGTYAGTCSLSDLAPHESLVMRLQGAGAPGTIDATVRVVLQDEADGGATTVEYDADAVVGGMVGGVGQRMLGSVSRRMAGEFFANVAREVGAEGAAPVVAPAAAEPTVGRVFSAPARPARRSSRSSARGSRSAPDWSCSASSPAPSSAGGGGELDRRRLDRPHDGGRRTTQGDLRPRAARPPPGADSRAQPGAQRDRVARRGARAVRGGRGGRRDGAGRRPGRAPRAAVRVQGHPRGRRLAYDVRLAAVRRPRLRDR